MATLNCNPSHKFCSTPYTWRERDVASSSIAFFWGRVWNCWREGSIWETRRLTAGLWLPLSDWESIVKLFFNFSVQTVLKLCAWNILGHSVNEHLSHCCPSVLHQLDFNKMFTLQPWGVGLSLSAGGTAGGCVQGQEVRTIRGTWSESRRSTAAAFLEHAAPGCPWLENDPCLAQSLTQKSETFTCQFAVALFPTLPSLRFLSTSILHSQWRVLANHIDIEHSQVFGKLVKVMGLSPGNAYARGGGGGGRVMLKSLTNCVS